MSLAFRAILVVAMSAALPAFAAEEEDFRRAVVAVGNCTDGLTADPARSVRDALARTALGFQVLSEDETVKRLGGIAGPIKEVRGLLEAARDDVFRKSSLVDGEEKLRKALQLIGPIPPTNETWRLGTDVRVLLAFVLWKRSQEGPDSYLPEADQLLIDTLSVDPDVDLDPESWFFPSWHHSYVGDLQNPGKETIRGVLKQRNNGRLVVLSNPAGLPIAVNGHPQGQTPITVVLPPGSYVVEGVFPGRRGFPRRVRVKPADAIALTVDPYFDGSIHQGKGPCIATAGGRDERNEMLAKAARAMEVNEIIGVRIEEPSPGEKYYAASAVTADTGKENNAGMIPVDATGPRPGAVDQLAIFLLEGKRGGLVQTPDGKKPDGSVAQQDGPKSMGTIFGYSLAGLGGVSAVVSVISFVGASNSAGEMEKQCPKGACPTDTAASNFSALRKQRDGQNTLGLVTAGITIAAGATAAYFLLTPEEAPKSVAIVPGVGSFAIVGEF